MKVAEKNTPPGISLIAIVGDTSIKYILELIFSLLHQSFADWECVFIDTKKNQAISTIIGDFAKRDHRIKIIGTKGYISVTDTIVEENMLQQIYFDYVGIIEANCVLADNALREIITMLIHDADIDIVVTDEAIVDDEGYFYPTCIKKGVTSEAIVDYWQQINLTIFKKDKMSQLINKPENFVCKAWCAGYIAKTLYYKRDTCSKIMCLRHDSAKIQQIG